MKGFAPSLAVMQQYRICLAPLRFGAGLKGKIVDSWAHGTPVCTTPIGAEGMFPATSSTLEGFPDLEVQPYPLSSKSSSGCLVQFITCTCFVVSIMLLNAVVSELAFVPIFNFGKFINLGGSCNVVLVLPW